MIESSRQADKRPLSAILRMLSDEPNRSSISVGDLLAALGDRAPCALLFIFALPNTLPMPPGTSAVLGAPLIFLAAQLMLGRNAWLPMVIAKRSLSHEHFCALVHRTAPWLERSERLLKRRISTLALAPMEYLIGLVCLLLALIVALPLPFGNMLPALAIVLMALGLLERDGLWVLAGLIVAVASAFLVSGVVFAAIQTGIFFFTHWLS